MSARLRDDQRHCRMLMRLGLLTGWRPSWNWSANIDLVIYTAHPTHLFGIGRRGFLLKTHVDIPFERYNSFAYLNADSFVGDIAIKLQGLSNIVRDIFVRSNVVLNFGCRWH